jgi:putative SOS response-associated peptidase YedK
MCGRANLPDDVSEIKLDLKIDFDQISNYQPRWNAAPTSKLPVVVSAAGSRILTLMRWGLIPSWAKDPKLGYSTFNARAETLATRAAFRGAWQAGRRCLVLVARYRQAAVRGGACQPWPNDAGRVILRLFLFARSTALTLRQARI